MPRPTIIVAHGQPSAPGPQQAAIEALARATASRSGRPVLGATLAMPGALDRAVAAAPGAMIYPMFMAAGWFTGTELPRRLAAAGAGGIDILHPFGLDPTLPELCTAKARQAAIAIGWDPQQMTLLLIAHGSQRARGLYRRVQPAVAGAAVLAADGRRARALHRDLAAGAMAALAGQSGDAGGDFAGGFRGGAAQSVFLRRPDTGL